VKIPVTEQIVKYSDWPVWHKQSCHAQNFFRIVIFSLEFVLT